MKTIQVMCVLVVLGFSGWADAGEKLWGCTFGDKSEVFFVDTADGSVSRYKDFGAVWFGDVAADPANANLYVTSWGSNGFDVLSRMDVATLTVQETWTLPAGMNALAWKTGSADTLYGIRGGGAVNGDLYEITVSGAGMSASLVGTIPSMASDGDIARDPTTGDWYATFLPESKTYLWDVDVATPAASTQGPELGDWGLDTGRVYISGLAFTRDGTLWGGSWGTNSGGTYSPLDLYTIDAASGPAGLAPVWDLSGALGGAGITGLAVVIPEPGILAVVALGAAALGVRCGSARTPRHA